MVKKAQRIPANIRRTSPGSLFGGDDDAAKDDLLAKDENQQRGDGGNNQRGEAHGRRGALLKLIEIDHHCPHGLLLAEQERQHEVCVCGSECTQGDDGEDGLGEAHRDVPEDGPFACTIKFGGLEKFARKRVEKSLDRKSTRLNSSHVITSRMPSSA